MASPFLLMAGGAAQGVAQGVQAGASLAYQQQAMAIQRQQLNISTTQGMTNALKIFDPNLRAYAVGKIMTGYGLDPQSADGKGFLKMVQNANQPAINQLVQGFASAGLTMSPEMVGYMLQNDPANAINLLTQLQLGKQANSIYSQASTGVALPDQTDQTAPPVTTAGAPPATSTAAGGSVPTPGQPVTGQAPPSQPAISQAPAAAVPAAPAAQPPTEALYSAQTAPAAPATAQGAPPPAQPAPAQPATQPISAQAAAQAPHPAVAQATVAGLNAIKLDGNGMPLPYDSGSDPVVQRLQTGINNLQRLQGVYPAAQQRIEGLQKQMDTHIQNMHSQYDEYISRIHAMVDQGHLAADWANVAINRANEQQNALRTQYEINKPYSNEGQFVDDMLNGRVSPQQALATGRIKPDGKGNVILPSGAVVPPATVGLTPADLQPAAAQSAPTQPGGGGAADAWRPEPTPVDGQPPAWVKQQHPEATQVMGPDGLYHWSINKSTTVQGADAQNEAKKNMNANATGFSIVSQALTYLDRHPQAFGTAGELQNLRQTIGARADSVLHSIGIKDPGDAAYFGDFFKFNPKVTALDALNHQVDFLVARQLMAGGGGGGSMMSMDTAMKAAEGMVGDWQGLRSPEEIRAHLTQVQNFFDVNYRENRSYLPTNSFADPETNFSTGLEKEPPPETKAPTGQGQGSAPTAPKAENLYQTTPSQTAPAAPKQTTGMAKTTVTQTPTQPQQSPLDRHQLTGYSTYPNLGGAFSSKFIPNSAIRLLQQHQNVPGHPEYAAKSRSVFDGLFGQGAAHMVLGEPAGSSQ